MNTQIKEILKELGADVCGIAAVDRFDMAPEGFSPTDIYSGCQSVIAFGIALPKGLMAVDPRIVYGHFNEESCRQVDALSFRAAGLIERKFGAIAVPIPCDGPYDYWDAQNMEGRGILSMKHAATLAGIGTLGKSTLLINREYGNALTIGAILTNLKLESDPLCDNVCLAECTKCIISCPVGAIEENTVNQKKCRNHTYGNNSRGFGVVKCHQCRSVCPMKAGERS